MEASSMGAYLGQAVLLVGLKLRVFCLLLFNSAEVCFWGKTLISNLCLGTISLAGVGGGGQ